MLQILREIAGKDGKKDLILLLGYIPLQIILSALLTILLTNTNEIIAPMLEQRITILSLFLASAITFIYILWAYQNLVRQSFIDFRKSLKQNIILVISAYFFIYLSITIFSILTDVGNTNTQLELTTLLQNGAWGEQLMLYATTILFVPVIEEMICRKIIMGFSVNFPELKWVLYIISSILFGFFHYSIGTSILTIIPYIFMGLVLGASYMKTKNILVPICIHILNNLISTVAIIVFVELALIGL